MFRLTSEQRWAVQQLVHRMEQDARDEILNPVILNNELRELDVAGVWLQYQLNVREKKIIFLRVIP
jgi:hypothetical protein